MRLVQLPKEVEDVKEKSGRNSDLFKLDVLKEKLHGLPIYMEVYNKEVALPIEK